MRINHNSFYSRHQLRLTSLSRLCPLRRASPGCSPDGGRRRPLSSLPELIPPLFSSISLASIGRYRSSFSLKNDGTRQQTHAAVKAVRRRRRPPPAPSFSRQIRRGLKTTASSLISPSPFPSLLFISLHALTLSLSFLDLPEQDARRRQNGAPPLLPPSSSPVAHGQEPSTADNQNGTTAAPPPSRHRQRRRATEAALPLTSTHTHTHSRVSSQDSVEHLANRILSKNQIL
ncbi:uncharacterized protein LOC130998211 [Salvia miltiorrhiza]|uniref:uncharacterized protein LOC130998211 n=1 Tax=Salvia miltiorrhiza TaxID=226208 RepID=UPI0025AC221D|nr:uncharacterized protein LOC130998211 [Salvia miltiorrhiza]